MQQPQDPTPSKPESPQFSSELRERTQIISKLMACFPVRPGVDPGTVLAAYLDETADIPLSWMREVAAIYRNSGLEWLPSSPRLREGIAKHLSDLRCEARGQNQYSPVEQGPIKTDWVLAWAAREVPLGRAQLAAVCGKDRDRLAIEAKNREAVQADAELTPHQQRSELTRLTLESIEGMIAADGLTPQLLHRQHERERRGRRRAS